MHVRCIPLTHRTRDLFTRTFEADSTKTFSRPDRADRPTPPPREPALWPRLTPRAFGARATEIAPNPTRKSRLQAKSSAIRRKKNTSRRDRPHARRVPAEARRSPAGTRRPSADARPSSADTRRPLPHTRAVPADARRTLTHARHVTPTPPAVPIYSHGLRLQSGHGEAPPDSRDHARGPAQGGSPPPIRSSS